MPSARSNTRSNTKTSCLGEAGIARAHKAPLLLVVLAAETSAIASGAGGGGLHVVLLLLLEEQPYPLGEGRGRWQR
jgi:hypothetical protein